MPELPEVETVREGLARFLPGRVVAEVAYFWDKSFPNDTGEVERFMVGAEVVSVRRRAKVLLIDLSSNYSLVIHLKMTGQLVFVSPKQEPSPTDDRRRMTDDNFAEVRFGAGHPNDSLVGELPDKSTRVIFTFRDGSHLYFNDQRKFGWVKLVESQEAENLKFIAALGPEPLEESFTWQVFKTRLLRRKGSAIKAVLLDQTVLAGVGNIYADESLWGAKIHPATAVRALSDAQIKKLHTELQFVLRLAIEKGGSTDRNYVNAEGKKGSYLTFARVFRREGQTCPRCGTIIIKTRVAGRGTHLCPMCQKQV